ncbi:MAG TPA: penicillin acylase family protein [Thermoanaerobaculia bacterium]|nr:penicillin acylase family protein [Thermoanaerobaculia bacterium]
MRKPILLFLIAASAHAAPVKVIRDKWGVPHIYAQNQHDLFFAQGFVQAQDRLYQMEVWKRAGQGRLAEVFGEKFVARDIAARKLRYRGSMESEYASYASDSRAILTAFTDGINAFTASRKDNLPAEFRIAGFAPEPWKPEDCLQRMAAYGLMSNAAAELTNAKLLTTLGVDKASILLDPQPSVDLDPIPGLDYTNLGPEILRDYLGSDVRVEAPPGSNNWVVSGALTESGKPILANDPHRTITIPSLRYIVHLVAPGWDVIGATEPALPGVSIGHNKSIAWGITVFPIDQQDFYIETVRTDHPRQYKTEAGWREMRIERARINVKGGKPVDVDIELTRHGPVIWRDTTRALALHWVGAEPGTAGYLASLSLDRAQNWNDFLAALRRWKVPAENIIYADRDGKIGEQSAGLAPKRSWRGLLPVDGASGRYEWKGWIGLDQLPRSVNPQEGFIATANHMIISPDDRRNLGYAWSAPYRVERIREVLRQWIDGQHKMTLADMGTLQIDIVSRAARETIALLRDIDNLRPDDRASQLLLGWDGAVTTDSAAAALYEIWLRRLRAAFLERDLRPDLVPVGERALTTRSMIRAISARPALDRAKFLLTTLHNAFADAQKLLGDDPSAWRWGTLHVVRFRHSLDRVAPPISAASAGRIAGPTPSKFDRGPIERAGDSDTVGVTAARAPSFEQVHGASFREILDLADWDRSLAINVPGQSGDPESTHYDDLITLWSNGEYFPLLFTKSQIEQNAGETTTVYPTTSKKGK